MLRIAHVNGTDSRTRLAIHTGNRCNGRHMFMTIVGHVIRRHYNRGVGLSDFVGDGRFCDIIVISSAGEAPGVTRVRSDVSVFRIAYVNGANGSSNLTIHARDRVGRGVLVAIIGDIIRCHGYRRVGLTNR